MTETTSQAMEGGIGAAEWISLAAVVIAGLSLLATVLERRGRREALAQERHDREEELGLLRAQVEGASADRERQRRAELSATTGKVSSDGQRRFDYHHFIVTNGGPATAYDLRFAAVGDPGEVTPKRTALNVLLAGRAEEIGLEMPFEASRAGGFRLHAWWRDETGEREADLVDIKRHG